MNKKQTQEIAQALALIGDSFIKIAYALAEDIPVKEPVIEVSEEEAEVYEEELGEPVAEEDVTVPEELEDEEEIVEEEGFDLSDLDLEDLQLIAKSMKLRGYKNLEHAELVEKLMGNPPEKLENALSELGYLEEDPEVAEYREKMKEVEHEVLVDKGEALPDAPEVEEEDEEEIEEGDEIDFEDFEEDVLKDICKELGVSTRGKKQALITRIYTIEESQIEQALINLGLIAVEAEEEEEVVEEPKAKKEKKGKKEPKRETMTPARAEVMKELDEAIEGELEAGNITYDDMYDVLEDLGRITEEEDDDDAILKEKYKTLLIDLTDDDGENHNFEDPYFVNDELRCCGAVVPVEDDKGECVHCHNVYTLE